MWDLPYTLIFTLAFVFCLVLSASRHLTDIPSPAHPHPHTPDPDPQPQLPDPPVSTYPCADLASCGMSVLVLAVRHRPLLGLFVARRYLSLTDSQHVKQRKHCRAESPQPEGEILQIDNLNLGPLFYNGRRKPLKYKGVETNIFTATFRSAPSMNDSSLTGFKWKRWGENLPLLLSCYLFP